MENETNNLPEEPKGPNKTLIIILSIVGAVVLLGGIGTVVLIKTVINKGKDLINSAQETQNKMIEEAKEEQDKMAEEARKQQKEVIDNIKESVTLLDYSDNGFTIKVQGKTSELWPAEDVTLYVNDKKVDEFTLSENDIFKVEKLGEIYILVTSNSFAQFPAEQFFVFDVDGNLVKELPSKQDDEHYITSIGYYCTGEYKDSEIILHCQIGMAYVYCKGDVSSYDYYYKVNGKEVTFDHFDTNYYEKDSIEETCNEKRNNP